MKSHLKKILLGNFLINSSAVKGWKYVIFLFAICLVMIYSSHSVDSKIIEISELKNEISVLQSSFIENRKKDMKLKMESTVAVQMKERGIRSSTVPPQKIIID